MNWGQFGGRKSSTKVVYGDSCWAARLLVTYSKPHGGPSSGLNPGMKTTLVLFPVVKLASIGPSSWVIFGKSLTFNPSCSLKAPVAQSQLVGHLVRDGGVTQIQC